MNLYPHQIGSGLFIVYFKFHKILFTGYLVMARLWILNQIKGSKSYTNDASKTKVNDHCHVLTIQIVLSFVWAFLPSGCVLAL